MVKRAAVVFGLLLVLGAAVATFLPADQPNAKCGTWVNPEWDTARSQELAKDFAELGANQQAVHVANAYLGCRDALDTRRTVTFVLLGLAVMVPVGVLFIAGGRREPSTA